jgi:hypothetical protein
VKRGTEAGCQSVTGESQVPPSSGPAENIFLRHILKREGSLNAAQGSAAAVSAMIELIAMAVGVVSAVCTGNLNPGVVVMEPAEDGA